jgi:UDP-GlcNAc:undecaprenyl-phosphate GlcNAc-1-phosphate transferase
MAILAIIGLGVVCGLLSACTVGLLRRLAPRLRLMDAPGQRKLQSRPVPLGGGLGIFIAMLLCLAGGTVAVFALSPDFWSRWGLAPLAVHVPGLRAQAGQLWVLVAGGLVMLVLGLIDDSVGLPWPVRLGIELVVAWGVVSWQGLELTAFIDLPWLTGLLSVLWIVVLVNSFNMLDNMDGLSGGVAFICAGMLMLMLLLGGPARGSSEPQLFVAAMLALLMGGLAGFLGHNWHPARIYMGDAGSYFVGYWLAITTLLATYTEYLSPTRHAVLAPLCILAVPLYDTLSVVVIRLREGRSPFQGDRRHFSHRLVELGFTQPGAVLTIYLASLTCGLGGVLLPRTDGVGAGLVLAIVACSLLLIGLLEHAAWGRRTAVVVELAEAASAESTGGRPA